MAVGPGSRRGSIASSDAGSLHDSPQPINGANGVTSDAESNSRHGHGHGYTSSNDVTSDANNNHNDPKVTASPSHIKTRTTRSATTSHQKRRVWSGGSKPHGPSGGIAGALAHSGMQLAYPGVSHSPPPTHLTSSASGGGSNAATTGSPPRTNMSRKPSVNGNGTRHERGTSIDEVVTRANRSGSHSYAVSSAGDPEDQQHLGDVDSNGGHGGGGGADDYPSEDESPDALSFDEDDIPVTGFAVASSKRNADFHELFADVQAEDYLIEDYGCALQRDILVQGRLYISENHLCFFSNIFGWQTKLAIAFSDITRLDKKMTAYVIPNAIQVSTRKQKYTFASFITRDTTWDVMHNVWRLSKPREDPTDGSQVDATSSFGGDGAGHPTTPGAAGAGGPGAGGQGVAEHKPTKCACSTNGEDYETIMMDCVVPGTPEQLHTLMWTSAFIKDFMINDAKLTEIQSSDWTPVKPGSNLLSRTLQYIKPLNNSLGPKSTKCEITDEVVHYDPEVYITTLTITRTPNVPSGNAFSVKTRTCLMWAGSNSTKIRVTSTVEWTGRSYIKGMIEKGAQEGQRTWHADLEVAMRSYINAHRSEFFPDGADEPLNSKLGADPMPTPINGADFPPVPLTADEQRRERARMTEQKSMQWAWDTFSGAWNVGSQSAKGAIELLGDVWEQSSKSTLLVVVVLVLLASNAYTLTSLKSQKHKHAEKVYRARMEAGSRRGTGGGVGGGDGGNFVDGPMSDSETLRLILDKLSNGGHTLTSSSGAGSAVIVDVVDGSSASSLQELEQIKASIGALEERLEKLKQSFETVSSSAATGAGVQPELD